MQAFMVNCDFRRMLTLISVIVISSLFSPTVTQEQICTEYPDNYYACGDNLADTLRQLCQLYGGLKKKSSWINSDPTHLKSSDLASSVQHALEADTKTLTERAEKYKTMQKFKQLFLTKRQAMAYMDIEVIDQGIVCECCLHQCTIDEMRGYCND